MNSIFMMVCFNGIFMRNVDNVNINPSSTSDIFENEINFGVVPNTATTNFYGIRLENSAGFSITTNTIDKQNGNNPSSAVIDKLRGISLLNSANNIVASNSITRLGTGIRAFGSCTNATLTCNVLFRNFHGFKFEGPADIDDQLPGQIPTGNVWTTLGSSGASDIDVDLVTTLPLTSWYRDLYPPTLTNDPTTLSGGGTTFSSSQNICSQFSIQSPIDERENKLGIIVRNEKTFASYSSEFSLSDRNFAFRFLKENPIYLSLGSIDDSVYQNFYQNCSSNCVGKFEKVSEHILSDSLSEASILNNSISANIQWENNLKTFNEIYIRYLDGDTITANDSIVLENMAYENAIDGGLGVFASRAFFNLDIEDTPSGTVRSPFFEEEVFEEELKSFSIFPNPSNGSIQISQEDETLNYDIYIKDVTGKLLKHISHINGNINLELGNLMDGIYFIECIISDQKVFVEKIVLIK